MKNYGILFRGKSLEKVSQITNNFYDCMIVNNFEREFELIGKYLSNKKIDQIVNMKTDSCLLDETIKKFNVECIQLSFPEKHDQLEKNKRRVRRSQQMLEYCKNRNLRTRFLPDHLFKKSMEMRNTGLTGLLCVSDQLKPENIWLVGLDFYRSDYLTRKLLDGQFENSLKLKMTDSFMNIVNGYKHINYHILSYCRELKTKDNLEVIES